MAYSFGQVWYASALSGQSENPVVNYAVSVHSIFAGTSCKPIIYNRLFGLTLLFGNLHHIEIHQAGVLVFVFLRQMQESILFVKGNGREVGIDGDETEG